MNDVVAVGIALFVLVGLAWMLYRPRVQQSTKYRAMVVPLSNIMDVGFIIMSPAIVLLAGYAAPLVMLGICLVAIAAGFAIAYNIRHYEPIEGTDDRINVVGHVFATYFVLQAAIAWIIARRKGNWGAVAGFTGIAEMMGTIAIFGLPL